MLSSELITPGATGRPADALVPGSSVAAMERLLRVLQRAVDAEAVGCWLFSEGTLHPAGTVGAPIGALGYVTLPDAPAMAGGTFFSGDTTTGPSRQLAWGGVPVQRRGVLLGAVAALTLQPREWSESDRQNLRDVAESLADQLELVTWQDRDMSMRQKAEQRYRQLFESSHDAIYMTTREGRFVDANRAFQDLFGYTRDELLQLNAVDLYFDAADRARFQRQVERDGALPEQELRMRHKDGSLIICLKSATVQRADDGTVIGYQGILHDITERKRAESELVHSAFHDALTALPNRSLLLDRLERLQRYARRHRGYRFALMFLDLDRFKMVNDSLGHLVGDQLLVSVARRLEGCVRGEDTVARLGGDEFAIIIDGITDASGATRVAERILHELQIPFTVAGRDVLIGVSIGISLSMTGYDTLESMINDADQAMYRAKTTGKSGYEVFDTEMHEAAAYLLQLESDLSKAVHYREFVLQYLPVFRISDRSLAGLEALVRWQHPERGLLMPGEFIQAAEGSGHSVPLGWWVLRQACMQLKAWQDAFGSLVLEMPVSVNLSSRQFLQPDLIRQIDRVLADTDISAGTLRLEINEPDLMRHADAAVLVLRDLASRGVNLIIDDFGTGFSSLSYLQRLPLHAIKIDRSFVSHLGRGDRNCAGLVRSILALGQSMGVPAIAEGVETEEQLLELANLGVQYAQGFLLSAPIDADVVTSLLQDRA